MAVLFPAGVVLWVNGVHPRPGDAGAPKQRPVVLITDLCDDGEPALGVAVTTVIRPELSAISVRLPFVRARTGGLTQDGAAVCDWTQEVTAGMVAGRCDSIPNSHLNEIIDKVESLFGN